MYMILEEKSGEKDKRYYRCDRGHVTESHLNSLDLYSDSTGGGNTGAIQMLAPVQRWQQELLSLTLLRFPHLAKNHPLSSNQKVGHSGDHLALGCAG